MKKRFLVLGATLTVLTLASFASTAKDEVKKVDNSKVEISIIESEEIKAKPIVEMKINENGEEYWVVAEKDYEKVDLTYYVNAQYGLNFREFPDIEQDNVYTALSYTDSINVIGISEDREWAMVSLDDKKVFCRFKYISENKPIIKKVETSKVNSTNTISTNSSIVSNNTYSASQLKSMGVINWGGWRWTWYSQRVLPGGGLNIPGRHVDSNGYVCDANGYICLASGSLSKGTVVQTPFGKMGKVYDSGCAANTLDVYTNF